MNGNILLLGSIEPFTEVEVVDGDVQIYTHDGQDGYDSFYNSFSVSDWDKFKTFVDAQIKLGRKSEQVKW